jgi:hypothetical protein
MLQYCALNTVWVIFLIILYQLQKLYCTETDRYDREIMNDELGGFGHVRHYASFLSKNLRKLKETSITIHCFQLEYGVGTSQLQVRHVSVVLICSVETKCRTPFLCYMDNICSSCDQSLLFVLFLLMLSVTQVMTGWW